MRKQLACLLNKWNTYMVGQQIWFFKYKFRIQAQNIVLVCSTNIRYKYKSACYIADQIQKKHTKSIYMVKINTTDLCCLAQYTPLTRNLIRPLSVPFLFHSQAGLTAIWWEWSRDCFHVPSMLFIVVSTMLVSVIFFSMFSYVADGRRYFCFYLPSNAQNTQPTPLYFPSTHPWTPTPWEIENHTWSTQPELKPTEYP